MHLLFQFWNWIALSIVLVGDVSQPSCVNILSHKCIDTPIKAESNCSLFTLESVSNIKGAPCRLQAPWLKILGSRERWVCLERARKFLDHWDCQWVFMHAALLCALQFIRMCIIVFAVFCKYICWYAAPRNLSTILLTMASNETIWLPLEKIKLL